MHLTSQPTPERHLVRIVSDTLLGSALVAVGLSFAFMVIATPLVSGLVPAGRGGNQVTVAMLVWALSLIAGGALLVAGTNLVAATVASVRSHSVLRSPVLRAISQLSPEVVVATGIIPQAGRPIPEVVVGPFGVAVVHALESSDSIRRVGVSWEAHTREGWRPTEHPIDRVTRDAERVRHWLTNGDLDFVVRVYAALVTPDLSIARSPLCAVITPDQIPAWIAALPRQRSLSAGRRHHLLARVREAGAIGGTPPTW